MGKNSKHKSCTEISLQYENEENKNNQRKKNHLPPVMSQCQKTNSRYCWPYHKSIIPGLDLSQSSTEKQILVNQKEILSFFNFKNLKVACMQKNSVIY